MNRLSVDIALRTPREIITRNDMQSLFCSFLYPDVDTSRKFKYIILSPKNAVKYWSTAVEGNPKAFFVSYCHKGRGEGATPFPDSTPSMQLVLILPTSEGWKAE